MSTLSAIDHKIQALHLKKQALERKAADTLYKKLVDILNDDFCPDLVVSLVADTWQHRTPEQFEGWRTRAPLFCKLTRSPKSKSPTAHKKPSVAVSEATVSHEK